MKRTLIALGVIAAAAAPLAAQAAPTVYGKLNIALEKFEQETGATTNYDNFQLSSYASRLGVKGEDTLTPSLSVVYGIEWEITSDGDSRTELGQRNRFVGIKHSDFGTLRAGRLDTNLKNVQGRIDVFNDTRADLAGFSSSAPAGQNGGAIIGGELRLANVISYESPKIADAVNINLQLIPGEGTGATGATGVNELNGIADGISASVTFDKAGLYLGLAIDKEVQGGASIGVAPAAGVAAVFDGIRVAASYKLADLTLGALYSIRELADTTGLAATAAKEEKSYLVSAAYKIDKTTLKAQYIAGENDAATAQERTRYALGADYALGSKTKLYGYYTGYEQETGATSVEATTLALGIDHSF